MPGDKFPMKWDEGLLRSLAPRCKVYLGPGAGYDKVDVDWISSTYVLPLLCMPKTDETVGHIIVIPQSQWADVQPMELLCYY